jgi:hypothetical protein
MTVDRFSLATTLNRIRVSLLIHTLSIIYIRVVHTELFSRYEQNKT